MEYLTWDCGGKLRVPDAKEIGCPKHISFLCDLTLVCISTITLRPVCTADSQLLFPDSKMYVPKY